MNKTFKIQGTGLDTRTVSIPLSYYVGASYDFIYTSLRSNNGYLLKNTEAPIFTEVSSLDGVDVSLRQHLRELGREAVDVLMINSECLVDVYKETLDQLVESGVVLNFGVHNPTSVDRLKEIQNTITVHYVTLSTCPVDFYWEIIEYCEASGINIIGFDIFGDRPSKRAVTDTFTVPYLLGFAATYCNYVLLDLEQTLSYQGYLMEMVGQETTTKYTLAKDVHKLYKPMKKLINTSLIMDKNITLPCFSPDTLYSPSDITLTIGKEYISLPEITVASTIPEIEDYLSTVLIPADGNDLDTLAIIRPVVYELFKYYSPTDDAEWKFMMSKADDRIFILTALRYMRYKRWFGKDKITSQAENYVLSVVGGKIVFLKLENDTTPQVEDVVFSDAKPSEPYIGEKTNSSNPEEGGDTNL